MVTDDPVNQVRITLVYCPVPREVHELTFILTPDSTVEQALAMAAVQGVAVLSDSYVGVWGKKAAPGQLLVDGDRVEIYRILKVDPKTARRLRFAGQGIKSAGLFSSRRAGAKAGY